MENWGCVATRRLRGTLRGRFFSHREHIGHKDSLCSLCSLWLKTTNREYRATRLRPVGIRRAGEYGIIRAVRPSNTMRSTAPFAASAAPAEAGHVMNAGTAHAVEKFSVADPSGSRKRRKILFAFLSGSILLTFALYEFLSLDGIAGIVFPLMFPDSTVYSEQWNYWSFRFVRKGMSVAEVMEMLGPPIRQWDNLLNNSNLFS